jgi:hypothetical protein
MNGNRRWFRHRCVSTSGTAATRRLGDSTADFVDPRGQTGFSTKLPEPAVNDQKYFLGGIVKLALRDAEVPQRTQHSRGVLPHHPIELGFGRRLHR